MVQENPEAKAAALAGLVMLLVAVILIGGLLAAAMYFADDIKDSERQALPGAPGEAKEPLPEDETEGYVIGGSSGSADTEQTPLGRIIAVILLGVLALYALRAYQTRKAASTAITVKSTPEENVEALTEAIAISLTELEKEPDPRRAIIASYLAFQELMRQEGWAKPPHYTSEEYLIEVLNRFPLPEPAVQTLTRMFQKARFSPHPVTEAEKKLTIECLVQLQQSLTAHQAEHSRAADGGRN